MNAVQFEGLGMIDGFIVVEHPMPHALDRFYILAKEKKCSSIVSLNDAYNEVTKKHHTMYS